MYIFVKVCLGSSYSIAVPDCNDTSSLEACNCKIRANSPVFTTFYFRFSHWAFWTKLIATTRLKTFQYRLVWTCIHKKLIACHSPNFRIFVGSRIILPVTLLQRTKTDDRKRSNWPPDVNQIVFRRSPRRSIWKLTAREFYYIKFSIFQTIWIFHGYDSSRFIRSKTDEWRLGIRINRPYWCFWYGE